MQVLVVNSGSSSIKFELFAAEPFESLVSGIVERIGETAPRLRLEGETGEAREVSAHDHDQAMESVLRALQAAGPPVDLDAVAAVGHRVVHGGDRFDRPVVIDEDVLDGIRSMSLLAPLHARANVAGIVAARRTFPHACHVAVFDTTFHRTMPSHAREYALPRDIARANGIRRYGFHGISHAYVARRAARLLGRPLDELRLITLHLGNGSSVAAISEGRSVDTSMGMTPLEGLVMGTRCGDVDPAVPMLLGEITGRSREDVHRLMNSESGLLGLTGVSDMREVHRLADAGDADAALALDMYCYRARKYVGAYVAALGRVDAVVFTAGIGEHDADVRQRIAGGLDVLGIRVDPVANVADAAGERDVGAADSGVRVLVIPTDEEGEIARFALHCAETGTVKDTIDDEVDDDG